MSDLVDRLNKQLSEMRLHALKRSSINPFGMVAEVEADQFTGFMHDVGEAADRIAELAVLIEQHKVLIDEQDKEIKRLREALDRYGAHDFECPYLNLTPHLQPCNCGYSKALKEVSDE